MLLWVKWEGSSLCFIPWHIDLPKMQTSVIEDPFQGEGGVPFQGTLSSTSPKAYDATSSIEKGEK